MGKSYINNHEFRSILHEMFQVYDDLINVVNDYISIHDNDTLSREIRAELEVIKSRRNFIIQTLKKVGEENDDIQKNKMLQDGVQLLKGWIESPAVRIIEFLLRITSFM